MSTSKHAGRLSAATGLGLAVLLFTGCRGLGPQTVARDRFDYSTSIAESWKRQTLLNIVKLRYMDPPIFVDVGQIVAGYSLETGMSAGASFPETTGLGGNTATFGGSAKFTDRPTVTYTPLTGNKFVRSLMTPLPPEAIFFTVQSGHAADVVFFATINAMNGLKNQDSSPTGVSAAEPRFLEALHLLRKIQLSGAVGLHVRQDQPKQQTTLITFRSEGVSDATLADIRELRQLLGLSQDVNEFRLVHGGVANNDHELAVQSRSLLHIMNLMAAHVDVPPQDIAEGRATVGFTADSNPTSKQLAVRIHHAQSKPADAHVAVDYHGHWFWIDDRDLPTKRAFAMIMLLFTLADTGTADALPLITIPAQ